VAARSLAGRTTGADSMTGRFAPSPTGPLHVGNLRTALVAWLAARATGDGFLLRIEDLDRVTSTLVHERAQQADLVALGLDWDGAVRRQSERFDHYRQAIGRLAAAGLTYECFCSRREVREAAAAPHDGQAVRYPGTCRNLTPRQRDERRATREPAIRLRAEGRSFVVDDAVAGRQSWPADDVVLRRNDGVPAYNLAVVVDDAEQGVDQVVRGVDLLVTTASQVAVARALGYSEPRYVHVGLVVGATGERLAKRDGAVTWAELAVAGWTIDQLRNCLAASMGLAELGEPMSAAALVERFDLTRFAARGANPIPLADLLG